MNFHARCLCGAPSRRFVADAPRGQRVKRSDPTGTFPLQRQFVRDLDARWQRLRKMIPDAVIAKTHGVNVITHAATTGDDPIRAFNSWINEAMRQLVLGATGAWTLRYMRQAGDAGLLRANMLSRDVVKDAGPDDEERDDHGRWTASVNGMWYHGSPTGVPGPTGQIHIGSPSAARMALEARIGIPADMKGWSGEREYGKTLLAGKKTLRQIEKGEKAYYNKYPLTGFNADAPDEDYYPSKMPLMGRDKTPMTPDMRPAVKAYRIIGPMKNTVNVPYSDQKANSLANAQQTRGTGKNGFFYKNEGEDQGSISAVVPSHNHLKAIDTIQDAAPPADRIPRLQTLCVTELQGICDAVAQQAVRAFGNGILNKQSQTSIARDIQRVITDIGIRRGHLLVSFMTVRAFSISTLDGFRANGISHVGTVAERVRSGRQPSSAPALTRDAKKKKKKWADPEDLVEVLTAGDDDVCPECEDISDEGPYTLEEAEGLIPAHPNCRCALIPADDARFASVHDEYDPDEARDDHGMWSSVGGAGFKSYSPPQHGWANVEGQNHDIDEPPLPNLKPGYSFTDKTTGKQVNVAGQRLSSGVIMREPDGRTWVVKPTNGFGGYNYTFPKGGVEEGLHPQANAIKETWEETGLKARITGWAGDYKGDTSITRMYHAEREGGHPKDKGWETEQVALAHPDDLDHMLNRSRDKKIAAHHILKDDYDPDEPRDDHGMWTTGGGGGFAASAASLNLKVAAFNAEKGITANGGTSGPIAYYHGNYGPQDVKGAHLIEVENDYEIDAINTAAKHGIALEEQPQHSGSTFKTFTMGHAVQAPSAATPATEAPIDMQDLTKISGKKGSNEGGIYENKALGETGDHPQYYIKKPATPDHVTNELVAAKLYQLAGVHTLNYIPVNGGAHVATEMEELAKNNVSQLNLSERNAAKSDFAVHAWISNWDAAGTGGDNIGVRENGEVVTLDTGGSLKYRAQGEPKGAAFGYKVTEINTLRDPSKNPDAAKLYGDMTNEQMIASMKRVTNLTHAQIWKTVTDNGGGMDLAAKMVARQDDLKNQIDNIVAKQELSATPAATPKTILGPNTTPHPQPPAKLPEPAFKTKMEHLKHLMLKGTTANEVKATMGWPSVSMPDNAAKLGLKLTKTKVNGVFHYKGEPMNPDEAKAAKAAAPKTVLGPNTNVKPSTVTAALTKAKEDQEKAIAAHQAGLTVTKPSANGKIGSAVEGETLATAIKNNGAPSVEYFPAEEKPKNYQDTHAYAVSGGDKEYTAMKDLLKKSGYEFEEYKAQGQDREYLGVKVPISYDATKGDQTTPLLKTEPAPHFDINTPHGNFMQSLREHNIAFKSKTLTSGKIVVNVESTYHNPAAEIAKYHPKAESSGGGSYFFPAPSQTPAPQSKPGFVQPAAPPAPALTPPTDAELAKAKKNVELQLQYVPGAPDVPQAHALIAEFNKKYAGKTLAEHELPGKVADFKQLQANMVPLQTKVQQEAAALANASKAEQAAYAAKLKAAQAAEAAAKKAAFEATMNDPKVKEAYEKLHSIGQVSGPHLDQQYASVIKKLASKGHTINGADAAYISSYVGHHYDALNENLWKGDKMNLKQAIYAKELEKSLDKMPSYAGTAERGVKSPADAFQRYADAVGTVVTEKGFSSYGATHKLWGTAATIHLVAKDLKDIRTFNSGEGGGELILQKGSLLHITKVNPKTKEVWAEQV